MNEQTQLSLVMPNTVEISADGMDVRFTPEATPDDLRRVLQYMASIRNKYDFVMAGVLRAARARFSDAVLAEQLELSGLSGADVRRPTTLVVGLGELPYRTELSSEHHMCVARAKMDALEKMYFLDKAVELGLTAHELKASINAGRILREDDIVGDIEEAETVYDWEERLGDAVDRVLRVLATLPDPDDMDKAEAASAARYLTELHDLYIGYNIRAQGHSVPGAKGEA
jgi:hypothetical protein